MKKKTLVALLLAIAAGGCCTQQAKPYKDALYRYGVAGQHILQDVPAPATDGSKARYDAFREACDEAVKLGGVK